MNIYINCILLFSVIIILFYIIDKNIENFVINDSFKNSIDSINNNKLNGISNKNIEGAQPNSSGSGWNLLTTNNEVEVIEHAKTDNLTYKEDFIIPIMKSNNQNNFVASVSSSLNNNNNPAYAAFNRSTDSTKYINTKHNYDKKSGLYKGSFKSPDKNFKEVKGEWVKIDFPSNNKNIVTSYTIKSNNNIYRAPNTFYVFGLLNDKWIKLDHQQNQIFTEKELKTYKLNNNTKNYESYCLIATVVGTPDLSKKSRDEEGRVSLSFKEWNLMHLTTITTTISTVPDDNEQNKNCSIDDIGNICSTQDGFGIINKHCECIINKTENLSEEEEDNNDENKCKNVIDNMLKIGKLQLPGLNMKFFNESEDENQLQEEENIDNDINFNRNINDKNRYFDGLMTTPCLYKNEDFDTWCRYFNSNEIPPGYNKNSLGSSKVLPGKLGSCFTNGKPDPNKARAICGYNSMQTLSKLEPVNNIIGYNKFTNCLPLNNTNFKSECSKILKTNISKSSAVEIMGYDCNPLYARAKCIYSKDKGNMFNNTFNSLKLPCS